jgi:hypothetical protein
MRRLAETATEGKGQKKELAYVKVKEWPYMLAIDVDSKLLNHEVKHPSLLAR